MLVMLLRGMCPMWVGMGLGMILLWITVIVAVIVVVWLLAAPFAFGYLDAAQWVRPNGGRGVWFGDSLRTPLRASTLQRQRDLLSYPVVLLDEEAAQ